MFWKPKGRPININHLEDGMHVEGYYKNRFEWRWRRLKHAEVRIKPYPQYDQWKILDLLIPGTGAATRLAIIYSDDEVRDDGSTQYRLYDGLIYTKAKKRRFP